MITDTASWTTENYEISVNGFVVLTKTVDHRSDDELYTNRQHPLDFLKKWIADSHATIPECGIKIVYQRWQHRRDKYHVGNSKCAFTVYDSFSIKFGRNGQREEQDIYLVTFDNEGDFDDYRKKEYYTPNVGNKVWYMMYDMEHGAVPVVPVIPDDEKEDAICEGHCFVAQCEWMTKTQCECLLALCKSRENAIYTDFN